MDSLLDPAGRGIRVLVLPDSDDAPAAGPKGSVRIGVAGPVGNDLATPELRIGPRPGSVLRATVPEASVDEDSDSRPAKDDIGSTSSLWQRLCIDAVAQTQAM